MVISYNPRIQRVGMCRYSFAGAYSLFSEGLATLGLVLETDAVSITGGDLTIKSGMSWQSPLMAAHDFLVFIGHSPIGEIAESFRYGKPSTTKACIVKEQLVLNRNDLRLSRRQVIDLFVSELKVSGFFGAGLTGLFVGLLLPRSGWQLPD